MLCLACAAADERELASPIDAAPSPDTPPTIPHRETTGRATVDTPVDDRTDGLAVDDVLLQLEHEPTFVALTTCNSMDAFGRMPDFTLYRDGTAIYRAPRSPYAFVSNRGEHVANRNLQHVLDLGFASLQSFEDECRPRPDGRMCVADASFVLLRARVGDELREIRNYAGWATHGEAMLHAIYDRVQLLEVPPVWGDRPYRPQRATLCVARDGRSIAEVAKDYAVAAWPLDPAILDRTGPRTIVTLPIDRPDIEALVERGAPYLSDAYFRRDADLFAARIVPWLPGVDHSAAIAAAPVRR